MKKMICKKACHVDYKQAGRPERELGLEGRRDEAISCRKRSEKVLKDRDLLFGKHLSLAIPGDCYLVWKCNTVPWPSSRVPDIRP